ncbi:type II secretion system GspH family protein [Candidatus Saccharibacteria bacterium]|nr:type II secretion system GspH family protein [Candidatus Saccharibacteria bacterium]
MAKRKNSGFTIIEVALVLAIAGLIFLVVFLAVPALQRNQRDDARKRDVSAVVEGVTNYTSNNNAIPGTGQVYSIDTAFTTTNKLATYIKNMSGNIDYVVVTDTLPTALNGPVSGRTDATTAANATDAIPSINKIVVFTKAKCGASPSALPEEGSSRQAAAIVMVEGGGGTPYCQDAS